MSLRPKLSECVEASLVLGAVGDALGYHAAGWEFCKSGPAIHKDLESMGGLGNVVVKGPRWIVSDDTVMMLATTRALLGAGTKQHDSWTPEDVQYSYLATEYKRSMSDMGGRAPGPTTMNACHKLRPKVLNGWRIPFDSKGGGCGAAMRATPIGLWYSSPKELSSLVRVGVEAGRMTHNHPTGYLGSLTAALFTSYALQGRAVSTWGRGLMETLPIALDFVLKSGVDGAEAKANWGYFTQQWTKYLELRDIVHATEETLPKFPEKFGVEERDEFYKSVSFHGWGGASGHDAPMIAYDAILGASLGADWDEVCLRGVLHGGDNDSTGVLAGAWYGAMNGYRGVYANHHKHVEKRDECVRLAKELVARLDGSGAE